MYLKVPTFSIGIVDCIRNVQTYCIGKGPDWSKHIVWSHWLWEQHSGWRMGEGRFVQLVAITSNNEQHIAFVFTLHCNGIMSPNPACIALCYILIEPKPYNWQCIETLMTNHTSAAGRASESLRRLDHCNRRNTSSAEKKSPRHPFWRWWCS